nr:retrovirus-related Pol polyprotein from transposon TNT 1-94 [Tanacetum cinerariifolium]
MREKGCASWDRGKGTWGGQEKSVSTVPVSIALPLIVLVVSVRVSVLVLIAVTVVVVVTVAVVVVVVSNCVSISTTESEYVAVSGCFAQVLWMRTQLTDYGFFYDKVPIYCDSKSALAISCDPVQHTRTKHIDVRYHFIKDHVEKGIIELYFVGTEYQLADLFTKSLPEARFKFLVKKLGMMSHET